MILTFIFVFWLFYHVCDQDRNVHETINRARKADDEFRQELRDKGRTLL